MALKVIIMAGGRGERFWPRSRKNFPKQFSKILSGQTMLEETVARFDEIVPRESIYISSGESYRELLTKLFPDWNEEQFILEPAGRDTAACIGLCTAKMETNNEDVLLFVPADHYIGDQKQFAREIKKAYEIINGKEGLLLLGVTPNHPSMNYGYIEIGKEIGNGAHKVVSFQEKPDHETAKSYITSGKYCWNTGMFMFGCKFMLKAFALYAPRHLNKIKEYMHEINTHAEKAKEIFSTIEKISFDYAVVEKIREVSCLKISFPWDDVGSWNALPRVLETDGSDNLFKGRVYAFDCKNTTCMNASNLPIVINSVHDLNIIQEKDLLYITSKQDESKIKKIIKDLTKNHSDLL